MGFDQSTHSEQKFENIEKPETVATEDKSNAEDTPDEVPDDPKASSLTSLDTLLDDITSSQEDWPKEALRKVLDRFGRMPRTGWSRAHSVFCGKFSTRMTLEEFKKKAQKTLTSQSGRKCSARDFKREFVKRVKTLDVILEENTLHEAKIYNEVRKTFLECIKEVANVEVDQAERTRKIPNEKINHLVLEAIAKAVSEYVYTKPPSTILEIAKTIQAAQIAYQRSSYKATQPSTWKPSILKKIEALQTLIDLLERVIKLEKLDKQDKSKVATFMSREKLRMGNAIEAREAISRCNERILVYTKKIEMHEKRKDFSKQNVAFELYRRQFYRNLENTEACEHQVAVTEIKTFWETMWTKREDSSNEADLNKYLVEHLPGEEPLNVFPSFEEFQEVVKWLPNWKAAGSDGIFNFFIKKLESIHQHLYDAIKKICLENQSESSWFYKGITYLIPKGVPKKGSDFRPITCMSNLYKLTTKCVTKVMQAIVENRELLAENQLGTVRMVQGAKEQALLNIAINKFYSHSLKTVWIDVKKAFDSVDHVYLIKCLEKYNFPPWILNFLKDIISKWKLSIRAGKDEILEKSVERGILQGDSLSPLLFVLCIDPLSRQLNGAHKKLNIPTESGTYITNHLLFIDDLKLLAESDKVLKELMKETKEFFRTIGLEMNKDKSATNTEACAKEAKLLEGIGSYKYLGITETACSSISEDTFIKVRNEIINRTKRLCETNLNAKNLFKAINEHAISVINYHIGVLKLEPSEFSKIDDEIRKVLMDYKIHLQPANKERLYLPRAQLGRGLCNIEHKSEHMLLELNKSLERSSNESLRRAAILKVEKDSSTHLALINSYLIAKYKMTELLTPKSLCEAQLKSLIVDIKNKECHERLFRVCDHELTDVKESASWLTKGNIKPRDEGAFCFLQDRNVFFGEKVQCPHCRAAMKTVDHLATKCDRMLGHDYTRRHNEVLKCIHLSLCNKYGLKNSKKLKSHSVQEVVANGNVEIRVDTRIKTDVKIQHNRPDLFVYDKKRKEITLIEVGITNLDLLTQVENEKTRKYDLIANELTLSYKCRVKIIPYVMTWEGLVTKYHKKHRDEIGLSAKTEAYIQSLVLKKTFESISFDRRRGIEEEDGHNEVDALVNKIAEVPTVVTAVDTQ